MNGKGFTRPNSCPDTLNRQALQLSFILLRPDYPALALRVRNCAANQALPRKLVHDVVAALSHLSKQDVDTAPDPELLTLRKLLLVWMDYEVARLKNTGGD